mgnify:CR=1 FL=1
MSYFSKCVFKSYDEAKKAAKSPIYKVNTIIYVVSNMMTSAYIINSDRSITEVASV